MEAPGKTDSRENNMLADPSGNEYLTDFSDNEEDVISCAQAGFEDYVDSSKTSEMQLSSEIEKSDIVFSTYNAISEGIVFGVTFLGRGHKRNEIVCQDYHLFKDLGEGWHLYIVSDGAGSATQAHRGAKMNCELAAYLLENLISKNGWKRNTILPSESEWNLEFYNICRAIKHLTTEKIESLDEPVKPRDFNATLLLGVVSPNGILCGHIGDGRMGYLSESGEWHSIITPHKGSEPNQTIFMMNAWDAPRIPMVRMSKVYVPESKVVHDVPKAIFMITDGCENASWNCVQLNESGKYQDVNTPFIPYWQNLIKILESENDSLDDIYAFIDSHSEPCQIEEDDRTLLIGCYKMSVDH